MRWAADGLLATEALVADCVAPRYNCTVTGAQAVSAANTSLRRLVSTCLAQNERRFGGYDPRLPRPTTMPRLARFALRFLRT